jgi:hypothetical protein
LITVYPALDALFWLVQIANVGYGEGSVLSLEIFGVAIFGESDVILVFKLVLKFAIAVFVVPTIGVIMLEIDASSPGRIICELVVAVVFGIYFSFKVIPSVALKTDVDIV